MSSSARSRAAGGERRPGGFAPPDALRVRLADLLKRPGNREDVAVEVTTAEPLRVVDTEVPAGTPVSVDLVLERLTDGVVASGRVTTTWEAACRRCLAPVSGRVEVAVRELFRPGAGPDDDAFPLGDEELDLTPLVREAVLLDLPLAPLCRADCAGICAACGADRNERDCGCVAPADPRWAALEALRGDTADPHRS